MEQERVRYHAYLLRLWQVKEQGRWVWRASLEDAHTHERLGFGTLDALFHYLSEQMVSLPRATDIAEEADD
ncbi:hypothetical protein KFU94_63360 [Chloroflexi bacterium TSY]|nr:hypothetical protein [Chloroflexi bacterium TSY]